MVPDLKGRTVRTDLSSMFKGWKVSSYQPILHDLVMVGARKVGAVPAPEGKVLCVVYDPSEPGRDFTCVLNYPDDFSRERRRL